MKERKEFSINEWRRIYDRIHGLGLYLKLCSENKIPVEEKERGEIEKEITTFTKESTEYMNTCGIKMPKPKWVYDRTDETTWISSEQFEYKHLIVPYQYSTECATA